MKRIVIVRHGESTENVAGLAGIAYDKNKIVLTKNGKNQAKITGNYLNNVFGKFDKVYSSPVKRCIETSKIIMNQIKYKNKLEINDLLIEIGNESSKLDGLSKEEQQKIYDNIKLNLPKDKLFNGITNWNNFNTKIDETKNPFDKLKLIKLYSDLDFDKLYFDTKPTSMQVKNNLKKFFRLLKKSNDTNILIITHGGCIGIIEKLICNIDPMNDQINFGKKNNCCIMCVELNGNKYSLISPANIKHLE